MEKVFLSLMQSSCPYILKILSINNVNIFLKLSLFLFCSALFQQGLSLLLLVLVIVCCDYRAAHMVYCGCALIFQPLLGIMLQWMLLCMPFGRILYVCVCVFIYFVNELMSYKLCMLSFFPMTASLHCPRITI